MRIGYLAAILLVGGLAALALAQPAPPPAATNTAPAAATDGVERLESDFDVYTEKDKVGHMKLRVMSVSGMAIIDEDFDATLEGKQVAFTTQQVFKGGDKPVPTKAKVTTHFGSFKAMDGTLVFSAAAAGLSAKVSMTGYMDPKGNLFPKPPTENKDMPVAAGTVLTHASLIFFGPRMLPAPGQKEKIVWAELPLWVEYPNLVNFRPGCILVRKPPAADGAVVFSIKQVFPGGNEELLTTMTLDKAGKVVELRLPKYTLRLHKVEGPGKPEAPKPEPKPASTLPPPEPI